MELHNQYVRTVHVRNRFSFAICLVDSVTGGPPLDDSISVTLEGLPYKALRKTDGYYVFVDLPADEYQIIVRSEMYLSEVVSISTFPIEKEPGIDATMPIEYVALLPRPQYPFPFGVTLLRFVVRDAFGQPASGASIHTYLTEGTAVLARLAQDEAPVGTTELVITGISGKWIPGSYVLLQGKEETTSEICKVAQLQVSKQGQLSGSAKVQTFLLAHPLRQPHMRWESFIAVTVTRSDEQGEAVVCLPQGRSSQLKARLEATYNDCTLVKEVSISESDTLSLGHLVFT